jgi:hypothetical protein
MAPDATNPARGEAPGLGKLSLPGGIDNRRYPTKNTAVQEQSKARFNYLARGIQPLGPAALGYLFCDLAAGKSFWPTVEAYAAIASMAASAGP